MLAFSVENGAEAPFILIGQPRVSQLATFETIMLKYHGMITILYFGMSVNVWNKHLSSSHDWV